MTGNKEIAEFWELKHRIDDEVKRLGWSTDECKEYILKHYNKRSRLVMTDAQLNHLLARLWFMGRESEGKVSKTKVDRRRKRRHT